MLEAVSPENHAHYFQVLQLLRTRYGLKRVSTDIACRMVKIMETEGENFNYDLPIVLQFYLHGSFHEWGCHVIQGCPWNSELAARRPNVFWHFDPIIY